MKSKKQPQIKKIEITNQQYKELNRIWFIYGNDGKKCTPENHIFIRSLIEHAEYDTKPKHASKECVDEVNKILGL